MPTKKTKPRKAPPKPLVGKVFWMRRQKMFRDDEGESAFLEVGATRASLVQGPLGFAHKSVLAMCPEEAERVTGIKLVPGARARKFRIVEVE